MTRRVGAVLCALVISFALVSCGADAGSGIEIGDITTTAKRVNGGGAGCPLRFDTEILRPSSVPASSIISPLRVASNASMGTIGSEHPGTPLAARRGVEIDCWFKVRTLRIDVSLVGVAKGTALLQLATRLQQLSHSTNADLLAFLDANGDLHAGDARVVPGKGSVAYASVAATKGNVGLLVAYSPIDGRGTLPDADELRSTTRRLASALAN